MDFTGFQEGNPTPLCSIHVNQIITVIKLARYVKRLNGIILTLGCIKYNIMKQYVLFYHLQSVSVSHITFILLNLIDLSHMHITMKTSLNITRTHTSSDDWIFALDF